MNDLLIFGMTGVVSGLALLAAHYFPWNRNRAELERTTAYAIGTSVVVGVPVIAMLLTVLMGDSRGELFWALLLVANTAVCGTTVKLAYWVDEHQVKPISLDEARYERS